MVQTEEEIALSLEAAKERARDELDSWVLDLELIDLFEVVATMGGHSAGFIDQLLELAAVFVDSKQRQLRLLAFAMMHKMPTGTPRAKSAVFARAFRKPPNRTWCPCLEAFWHKEEEATLVVQEQALQYFHDTRKSAVADTPLAKLQSFKANTICVEAEVYARWRDTKCNTVSTWKIDLSGALKKFYDELVAHCKTTTISAPPTPVEAGIDFAAVAAKSASTKSRGKGVKEEQLLPKVIQYDPVTAQPTISQKA